MRAQDLTDHTDDARFARSLAEQAGQLLLSVRQEFTDASIEQRRDAGDQRSHQLLARLLAEHRPGDALLSEEGFDDLSRLRAERVWIVDPLDGTREFGDLQRQDWAVHVALWQHGALVAGAITLPAQGVSLATDDPPPLPPMAEPPTMVLSRSRPPQIARTVAKRLGAIELPMGSAGAKIAAVIDGTAQLYVHDGGQYEWDSAAPVAVALAAGLHASRLDGTPLEYNREQVWLPDLIVCQPDLAPEILQVTKAGAQ